MVIFGLVSFVRNEIRINIKYKKILERFQRGKFTQRVRLCFIVDISLRANSRRVQNLEFIVAVRTTLVICPWRRTCSFAVFSGKLNFRQAETRPN